MARLPIDDVIPELKRALQASSAVVLHAPPGAGKTTRVPLALLEVFPPDRGKILMLEPRRIAAASAARWMAKSIGEEVGGTVGYTIRFETRISERTRVEVVTEGILTRRLQADPALAGTALVIFDEFHERSLHADLALALCLDARSALREDLKVMVMSATLDQGPIASLLGNAPIIASSGRSFPVEERYLGELREPLAGRVANAVRTALRETNGDILVFLPGTGEIRSALRELQTAIDAHEERLSFHPLYGDLPFEEQERAIMPLPDKRKVVLATNIAETSLTIEGVQVVIDSGLTRTLRYDPSTGMNRLVTIPVSRASAEQRKGRAGRLAPGTCYRLFSKQTHQAMVPFTQPEILVSDLAPLALELAVWGVQDPGNLIWLDMPPSAAWSSGRKLLQDLGALDAAGLVTAAGREVVRLPVHPRLGRIMLYSRELGCPRLGADLAALLTERDLLRGARDPDIMARLEFLLRARGGKGSSGADASALRAVERSAGQLLRILPPGRQSNADVLDARSVGRLLLAAFPDRICKRRDETTGGFVHLEGRGVRLSRDSPLAKSPYIVAAHVDLGEGSEGLVHLAMPLTEDQVRYECSEKIATMQRIVWDQKGGRVIAAREERLGVLVLSTRPFTPDDDEVASILVDAIRTLPSLLRFDRDAQQFQARVLLIRSTFPDEAWPDLSDRALFDHPGEWLLPWLHKVRTAADLGRIPVLQALKAQLSWEQQQLVDERAPAMLTVPSGSRIRLDYASGEMPVLAVKLQEMFGLADTPTICGGRVQVLLHLLSPARRPVQVTRDLRNFWNTIYPEVKKDLKGRYPKHPWPDDPWNAVPTKRTKPRGK